MQTDPELAALSESSHTSTGSPIFTGSTAGSTATGPSSNASEQSFFDHAQFPAGTAAAGALATSHTPRKARSRQTTFEGQTLKPPSPPGAGVAKPAFLGSHSKKNSWAARHDINGTVMREGDVGNGMHTIRPVKRFDSVASNRQSAEFIRPGSGDQAHLHNGSVRSAISPAASSSASTSATHTSPNGREAAMGRALVDEVVLPTLDKVGLVAGCR